MRACSMMAGIRTAVSKGALQPQRLCHQPGCEMVCEQMRGSVATRSCAQLPAASSEGPQSHPI